MADLPVTCKIAVVWTSVEFATGGDGPFGPGGVYTLVVDGNNLFTVGSGLNINTKIVDLPIGKTVEFQVFARDFLLRTTSLAAYAKVKITPADPVVVLVSAANTPPNNIPESSSWETTFMSVVNAIAPFILPGSGYVIKQVTNKGASLTSANYNGNGGYLPYTGTDTDFTDDYPIGAQVHIEIRGTNGKVQVIDFQAGQPQAPSPTSFSLIGGQRLTAIVYSEEGAQGEGSAPYVQLQTTPPAPTPYILQFGGDSPINIEGNYDSETGIFQINPDDPGYDFFSSKSNGTLLPYLILDSDGSLIDVASHTIEVQTP